MSKETPFNIVTQSMLNEWRKAVPERPAAAEDIYRGALGLFTIKMRLTLFRIEGNDPLRWHMKAIRHSGVFTRVLNINNIFADCRIDEFEDRTFMEETVVPRLKEVLAHQQPTMELVRTKLLGVNLGYDSVLLPQKNSGRPEWIISVSNAQFLLNPPAGNETLDIADETIVQLLIEGATAKEIAATIGISHRTVEHRLERMKERFGAKNTVHLVAMLIATHIERSTPYPRA